MDRVVRASLHRISTSRGALIVEVFGGEPPDWSGFAMAERQADDSLVLAIYALEHRSTGYPAASGGVAFALLLSAARAVQPVPAIIGEWHPSSDNFKEFKRLRGLGLDVEAAARGTFTGGEALRHGYSQIVCVEDEDHLVRIRFEPGATIP